MAVSLAAGSFRLRSSCQLLASSHLGRTGSCHWGANRPASVMAQLQAQLPQMDEVLAKELSRLNFSFCVADCTLPDCPIVYASQVRIRVLFDRACALEGLHHARNPTCMSAKRVLGAQSDCAALCDHPAMHVSRVALGDSSEESSAATSTAAGAHKASHGWLLLRSADRPHGGAWWSEVRLVPIARAAQYKQGQCPPHLGMLQRPDPAMLLPFHSERAGLQPSLPQQCTGAQLGFMTEQCGLWSSCSQHPEAAQLDRLAATAVAATLSGVHDCHRVSSA